MARVEGTGGWGNLHNKGFHNSYCAPGVINMIKSKRER
jgi:hypothetical protein